MVELNHQNFLLKFHLSKSRGLNLEPVADRVLRLLNTPEGLGFFSFSVMSRDMHACVCTHVYFFFTIMSNYFFYNEHD